MKRYLTLLLAWGLLAMGFLPVANKAMAQTFPANLTGSYEAPLIVAPNFNIPVGRIEFTVTANGAVGQTTGKVYLPNGKAFSFKTELTVDNETGLKTDLIVVKGRFPAGPQPLIMTSLRVYPNGNVIAGFFSTMPGVPLVLSAITGTRFVTYTGKEGSVAPWAGLYTMAMTPVTGSAAGTPAGAGFASLSVAPTGLLSYAGKLGDGTKFTGSAKADANKIYRIYKTMYLAGGFVTAQIDMDVSGYQSVDAVWNKPANAKDKIYKNGFSSELDVQVQRWIVPAKKAYPVTVLGFGASKNFAVDFSDDGLFDGNYLATLPDTLRITGAGVVQAVAGGAGAPAENNSKEWNKLWSVKLNPATGVFVGKQVVRHMNGTKAVTRTLAIEGVLLLGSTLGDGPFALGQYRVIPRAAGSTEVTGLVSFVGPLEDNLAVAMAGTYNTQALLAMPDASSPISSPKPLLPKGAPALTYTTRVHNASERAAHGKVTIIVAEDLQSVKVNNVKLNFVAKTGASLYDFTSVVGGVLYYLKIQVNPTTGNLVGYILSYQQFFPARIATFTCDPSGHDADVIAYTRITKL